MKVFCSLLFLAFVAKLTFAQAGADKLLGTYLTQDGTAKIEFYKSADKYCGKIVWLKEPNDPKTHMPNTDTENPDHSKRNNPVMGLVMLQNLTYNGKDGWNNGTIYDPNTGKTWECDVNVKGNTIKVNGYWKFSWIGKTETWTKSSNMSASLE